MPDKHSSPGAKHRVVWDLLTPDLLATALNRHRLTDRELDELADAVTRLLASGHWPPGPPSAPADQHEYGMVRFETPVGTLFCQHLTDRPVGTRALWIFFALIPTGSSHTRIARILQIASDAAFTKDRGRLIDGIALRLPLAAAFDGTLKRPHRR